MSYVDRLKALIAKHGGSADGVRTVSDAISVLESLEMKPKAAAPVIQSAPAKTVSD